jgi:N-ATPase, AtpR subunit
MIAVFAVIGLVAGVLYFALLRWNTALYVRGDGIATAAALQIARMAGIAGLLALAVQWGALALLLTAIGLLAARPIVVRWMP